MEDSHDECPKCGSAAIEQVYEEAYICEVCGTLFELGEEEEVENARIPVDNGALPAPVLGTLVEEE